MSADRASNDRDLALVRRFIDEVFNDGRLELLDSIWHPDLIWRGGSLGEYHGIEEYRAYLERTLRGGGLVDLMMTVHDAFATEGRVITLFDVAARHVGDFMGVAGTGRAVTGVSGIAVYRVVDSKIVEATFAEDLLGMLIRLGIKTLPM